MSSIFIRRFWTEYKPEVKSVITHEPGPAGTTKPVEKMEPTGQMRAVDMVEYSPLGSVQKTSIKEAVSRLSCVLPLSENPAVQAAHARWNQIKPAYEAWKQGQEMPINGTPLAAWNGVTPELAELFKMKGVRSVEDVAALTDTHIQTMGIPGLRNIIENAKRFLTTQASSQITDALKKKDEEIAELKAQMAELVDMVKEAKAAPEAPKRRGRPPKVQPESVAA